ncbi:hypothetical protein MYOV024v1_p0059 [Vibrio phage PS34B.2]|nr:hypothetical protein MYOV024v1_p0059 [Vibrio phage PS34B.2]
MLRVLFTYRIGRVMGIDKMITKKEDLINTYIENDSGELRDLYTKKAIDLGLSINVASIVTSSRFIFTKMNPEKYGNVDHASRLDYLVSTYGPMREVTLSDLKPRTKTEFVKCEFEHAWEAVKAFGEGEKLYTKRSHKDFVLIDNAPDVLRFLYDLHRKVETEIDEQQEFVDRMLEMLDFNEACDGNKILSDMYGNFGFRFKLMEK